MKICFHLFLFFAPFLFSTVVSAAPWVTLTSKKGKKIFHRQFKNSEIKYELELGESYAGVMKVSGLDNPHMELTYQTSLTIMDEGPHLDLVDWKHFTSGLRSVSKKENGDFHIGELDGSDISKFPFVTQKELVDYVAIKSKRWFEVVKKCKGPNIYPCGVSLSKVQLHIYEKTKEAKEKIGIVTLKVPMGC
jgi:hypothetical protein